MQENDEKGRMGRGRRLESRTKACILNPLWKAYSWGMGMERPWEATPGQSLHWMWGRVESEKPGQGLLR